MSTTLTIRNLDDRIKQKLRVQAARHGRSMEAEARQILTHSVLKESDPSEKSLSPQERMEKQIKTLRGTWKGRGSTDKMMRELRGDD